MIWYAPCLNISEGQNALRIGFFNEEEKEMLWTLLIVLLVLWALGFGFAGAAVGNLIHILLVLALVVLAIQLISGRRAAL